MKGNLVGNPTQYNKALQLIRKSGAPIVTLLLLSTELNRYMNSIQNQESQMSRLKNVFLALLSLLITACSTISYQEPTSGPVAKVRFSTKHDGIVIVRNYKAENCTQEEEWMRLKNGFLLNSSPKKLNMALWNYHDNAAKEFLVTSSDEKYFMFFGSEQIGSTVYSCAVPVSVIFKPNHDYELLYKFGIGKCSVALSEITKTDKGYIKETKNVYINVLNSKTMNCSKSFSKARWY